ncbi:MAG: NUDIX domain-containing protein [Aquificales bacterium]|nr:NUDIX domain-containing protein [Aquificales bacterium]
MSEQTAVSTAPEEFVYCPKCATPLITRPVGDKPRRACPDCGYVYFTDPKVGVGVLVVENGRLLLICRAMNPQKGKWSIPAGFVDSGEDPQKTAVRETLEETNLEVTITSLEDVYFNANVKPGQAGASIFIMYRAKLLGGQLQAGDDAADAKFFALDNLPELAFASSRSAIKKLKNSYRSSHSVVAPGQSTTA